MRTRLPPNVERNRVKGRNYYYFRIGKGPRIKLPSDPNSEEFRVAYAKAMAGGGDDEPKLRKDAPGTIGALIEDYLKTKFVKLKSKASKAGYLSRLDRMREDHGYRNVSTMTRERIVTFILDPLAAKPGAALDTLKKLRILIKHAIDLGWLRHDPSFGIKRPKTQEIRAWTDAELAAFERRWPLGTKQRTAYALMLYMGTARQDTHLITWVQVETGSYVRKKTGVTAYPGVPKKLKETLARWPQTHAVIITTAYGKPFSLDGFSQFMRDAIREGGLPLDCQPHGLRKTLGRLHADAGSTGHDIMATHGHTELKQTEIYTREANRRRGGNRATEKLDDYLDDQNANKTPQTVPESLGESSKTKGKSK
jgi:integrase